ncbi:UvrD-helicase domain-containing protein, partial [Thermogutta sp.]|uniref:UvrD-helicase domain-containing protein n=1 Tax=Thermogutta sp. TaxID=1962930 RepID=UPI003C7AE0DA
TTALRDRGILRFSDVARLLRNFLQANGSAGLSLWQRRLGWRIRHLLLDEFQDTSAVQWAVLAPFAKEVCQSQDGSFFCVGDVKQSIYGWRGSEPGIFARIESELPHVDVQNLDITWRSSPIIVDVVNRVFSTLTENPVITRQDNLPFWRRAAETWVLQFSAHHTTRAEYPGYCCVVVRQKGGQSEEDETDGEDATPADPILVEWIGEVYQAPSKPTIGVLVRTNAAIDPIVAALRGAGFEVSQEGRNPVTTAVSVQLVLNVLRIADHPGDTAAAFRLGHSPLASLLDWNEFPQWDAPTRLEKSLETSHRLRERLLDEGYGKVIREFANAISEHTPREEHLWLEKLVELAHLYDKQRTLRADDFIRWLEHQQVADPQLTRIRVMTVHGAKGLQFDAVFLPDLDEPVGRRTGHLVYARPSPGQPIDWVLRGINQELIKANVFESDLVERYYTFQQRCVEEDFSLLYVAMTRAVHGLYIFVSPTGSGRWGPPKTLASIVWNGLQTPAPQTPGDILFEHGQRDWFNRCPTSVSPPPMRDDTTPTLSPLRSRPGRLRRSVPWRTPHEMEGTGISADVVLRFQPFRSLAKGSVWHMWFSRVRWLDQQGIPSREELRKTLALYPELSEAFETLYREFVEMLGRPNIKRVLSLVEYQRAHPSGYRVPAQLANDLANPRWEVFLEQPFVVDAAGAFCRGQFDRIVVLFDGHQPIAADVIDFKTDEITLDQLAGRVQFYRSQLVMYREAAARWLHVPEERVSARLVFTQPGEVIRVV